MTRAPYGLWRRADGREVLFDRSYCPVYSRFPGQAAEIADPDEFVDRVVQEQHFWTDGRQQPERCLATRRKLDRLLSEWGVR
jgi:hypothetical protein